MPITVNWSDLEIAFERNSPDQESFLDLENGDLLAIVEGEPDAAARRARVATNPERYLRIDPGVLAGAVPLDGAIRLVRVGRGAARAAADRHRRQGRVPAVQGRAAGVPGRARALVRVPVRAAALPHSDLARSHEDRGQPIRRRGAASSSRRSPSSCRARSRRARRPGEILRRQARELLDEIPAAELPPALAFLEFLRDRGASLLLGIPPDRARDDDDDQDDDFSPPALAR